MHAATPGSIIGYRRNGAPIRLQAGASEPTPTAADQGEPPGAAPGSAPAAPPPGVADQSAEDLLTAAVAGDAGTDPAAQLAAAQAEAKKWRDLSRKNETRAAANAGAAARLTQIEDASKTELQRANDAKAAAEQVAAEATALYQRTLAAARYDVPPDLIGLITGATADEANASAEALAAAINQRAGELAAARGGTAPAGGSPAGGTAPGGQRPQRPVESMRPGGMPASGAGPSTPDEWIRSGWNAS